MATKVVNLKYDPYDVYIGRGSIYGNPYKIGKDGTREEVLEKYRQWLHASMFLGELTEKDLLYLKDKRLGCFCKPEPCHGDILVELICTL